MTFADLVTPLVKMAIHLYKVQAIQTTNLKLNHYHAKVGLAKVGLAKVNMNKWKKSSGIN